MTTQPQPKQQRSLVPIILGLLGGIVLCCLLNVFISRTPPPTVANAPTAEESGLGSGTAPGPSPTIAPTDTPVPTDTPAPPTATPEPTTAPEPTATLEPAAALEFMVTEALGDGNRDLLRLQSLIYDGSNIEIQWTIDDNLTEGWIKAGAREDVRDILQAIVQSGAPFTEVLLRGSFPLTDAFGATEERIVVNARYSAATVARIDFGGFDPDNVYVISDNAIIHPAFQEE